MYSPESTNKMSSEIRIIIGDDKPPVVITLVNGTVILNDDSSRCIEQSITRAFAAIRKFTAPKSDKKNV